METSVQAKLLKAIEEQRITRIGGTEQIPVDVRIIAATNVEPMKSVEEGRLREDLYYRLKVVQLDIPPLRERREDIGVLTDDYIRVFNRNMERDIKGITPELREAFLNYSWPGNIRELRNMIESGFNLCDEEYIGIEDIDSETLLSRDMSKAPADFEENSLKDRLNRYERYIIKEAVKRYGSQLKAAEMLGVSRQTLNNKMKTLNITGFENGE